MVPGRFAMEMWAVGILFVVAVFVGPLWLACIAWGLWLAFTVLEIELWFRGSSVHRR